jgi:hypothetical protein
MKKERSRPKILPMITAFLEIRINFITECAKKYSNKKKLKVFMRLLLWTEDTY